MMSDSTEDNTYMVLIVFFILVILVILLLFLYKHLNRETKDKYTIQKLVLGEGGLRDRVMQGVAVVQTRLIELRPPQADEEQALNKNEDGNSGEEKEEGEEEEEEEESTEQGHSETENIAKAKEEEPHNDSLDDCSSVGLKEGVKQNNSKEEEKKDEEQEKEEGAKDEAKGDDSKQEDVVKDEEKVGLLVDLKPFSGSAIWSEAKKKRIM